MSITNRASPSSGNSLQSSTAIKRARSFVESSKPWYARMDPRNAAAAASDHNYNSKRKMTTTTTTTTTTADMKILSTSFSDEESVSSMPTTATVQSMPVRSDRKRSPPGSRGMSRSRTNLRAAPRSANALKSKSLSFHGAAMLQSGSEDDDTVATTTPTTTTTTALSAVDALFSDTALKFLFCFCGLQLSYLSWAYLQEFIMTTKFEPTPNNPSGRFPSASFCVFCNRCVAMTVALTAVRIRHGAFYSNSKAPVVTFLPCAISNTLSSISQYASLKYVSFPLMTVFKSSTIIPVMIMGYLIKGSTYPFSRYVEAALITTGVAIFSISSHDSTPESSTPFGMMLLAGYVIFDSFTTQWQDKIYSVYGRENVDPYQMMLGVDTTAILFTTVSLLFSGDLPIVWEFFVANPHVLLYNLLCPIASTCGQLCIFYTIKEFGPVVFTIIMTTRKLFSIGISSALFGHTIEAQAVFGGALVLGAILHSVHRSCSRNHQVDDKKMDDAESVQLVETTKQNAYGAAVGDKTEDGTSSVSSSAAASAV